MKEETYPDAAYTPLFILAPMLSFIPALITFARDSVRGAAEHAVGTRRHGRSADLPIGFLFILAISSLGVYGIVLAGWASNNKYSLLGGLRSSAQMVSLRDRDGHGDDLRCCCSPATSRCTTIVSQQQAMGLERVHAH